MDEDYRKILRDLERDPDNPILKIKKSSYEKRLFGIGKSCHVKTTITTAHGSFEAEWKPTDGLSVLYGANGVGKTQLMRAVQSFCGGLYYNFKPQDLKVNQLGQDNHSFVLPDGSNLGLILAKIDSDKVKWKEVVVRLLNFTAQDQKILNEGGPENWFRFFGSGTLNIFGLLGIFLTAPKWSIVIYENMHQSLHHSVMKTVVDMVSDICEKRNLTAVASTVSPEFASKFSPSRIFVLQKKPGRDSSYPEQVDFWKGRDDELRDYLRLVG